MSVERRESPIGIKEDVGKKPPELSLQAKLAREKLAGLLKDLKETEIEEEKPLSLREGVKFLRAIHPGYPSLTTLSRIIKTAVIFGDLPLPPEAVRVDAHGLWYFALFKKDLIKSCELGLQSMAELSLRRASQEAERVFEEKRVSRTPIENLLPVIFQKLGYSEDISRERKTKIKKFLIEKLQEEEPPLPSDVRAQEILILGVPEEEEENFIISWTELLEKEGLKAKEKRTSLTHMFKNWPSLTSFLGGKLGKEEKIYARFFPYAVTWLKAQGISVTTLRCRQKKDYFATYHRLSEETEKELNRFLEVPKNQEELARILKEGFSLEEVLAHREYFPEDFCLSVSELYRLASGKRRVSAEKNQIIKTLEDKGITVIEEVTPGGAPLHKVPFSQVERGVSFLEEIIRSLEPLPPKEKKVFPPKEAKRKLIAPFSAFDLVCFTGLSLNTFYVWGREGLIGTKDGRQWVFSQEDLVRAKKIKRIRKVHRQLSLDSIKAILEGKMTLKEAVRSYRRSHAREKQEARFYSQEIINSFTEGLKEKRGAFNLPQAVALISQVGQKQGIRIKTDFQETLAVWTQLTFNEAIEDNNSGLLSPTSLARRLEGSQFAYCLTSGDLINILLYSLNLRKKELPLWEQDQLAKERLAQLTSKNISLNQVALDLFGGYNYHRRRKLETMFLDGFLSLGDYPFLFANTIGIPKPLYQVLLPFWQRKIEKVKENVG